MNDAKTTLETQRIADLEDYREMYSDVESQFGFGTVGYHELLDRLFVMSHTFELVRTHPSAMLYPELYEKATKIDDDIADLYQFVANLEDRKENELI